MALIKGDGGPAGGLMAMRTTEPLGSHHACCGRRGLQGTLAMLRAPGPGLGWSPLVLGDQTSCTSHMRGVAPHGAPSLLP